MRDLTTAGQDVLQEKLLQSFDVNPEIALDYGSSFLWGWSSPLKVVHQLG
jgi:hypothetical protein